MQALLDSSESPAFRHGVCVKCYKWVMEPFQIIIDVQPRPIKNNQSIVYNKYTKKPMIVKDLARSSFLDEARLKVASQHNGGVLKDRVDIQVRFRYSDLRVPDSDNALNFVYDAIKGIVIEDDKPQYIGRTIIEDIYLDRNKQPQIEMAFTKSEKSWSDVKIGK